MSRAALAAFPAQASEVQSPPRSPWRPARPCPRPQGSKHGLPTSMTQLPPLPININKYYALQKYDIVAMKTNNCLKQMACPSQKGAASPECECAPLLFGGESELSSHKRRSLRILFGGTFFNSQPRAPRFFQKNRKDWGGHVI